jgi:hypothetical protein
MKRFSFLAYFPKMKVSLSYHLSVCVSPTNNLIRLIDFRENWCGINAIQGGLDAVIFNPIASVTLNY